MSVAVETLQALVNGSLGGAMASVQEGGGGAGPVCLPRRAETFGGFDSHQMHSSKSECAALHVCWCLFVFLFFFFYIVQ